MLLGINLQLENCIIHALSERPNLSAKAIHQKCRQNDILVSIQSVYKVLKQLEQDAVIIKNKTTYSLRIPWILNLAKFAERAESVYFDLNYLKSILPKDEKQKISWQFSDMVTLDGSWAQVLLAMAHDSTETYATSYCPHTWFDLIIQKQNDQFLNSFHKLVSDDYMIVGGNTPLDRYSKKIWEKYPRQKYFLLPDGESFKKERNKSFTVIDDYILTITLDQETVNFIDEIYKKFPSYNEIDPDYIIELVKRKIKAKLVLKKHPKDAQKIKNRFKKIFGPL